MEHRTASSIFRAVAASLALLACAVSPAREAPLAELVAVTTQDRVMLHGLLYRPAQPSRRGVVHIPGGPGAFYSAQDMGPLASKLGAMGWNFLTINMRTAGANGMAYAHFADYRLDIEAAMRLAASAGFDEIVLLGHSLGSARAVNYLATSHDARIRGLVLSGVIASPYLEAQMRWGPAERARYDEFLAVQRQKVSAGRAREIASFPWAGGRDLELSAGTWVDVFGRPEESDASTVKFASAIAVPVMIVQGSRDEAALPANADQLLAALPASIDKRRIVVEGADHLFIGLAEPYAQVVANWIGEHFPGKASADARSGANPSPAVMRRRTNTNAADAAQTRRLPTGSASKEQP